MSDQNPLMPGLAALNSILIAERKKAAAERDRQESLTIRFDAPQWTDADLLAGGRWRRAELTRAELAAAAKREYEKQVGLVLAPEIDEIVGGDF
jgi:hypothetical protein